MVEVMDVCSNLTQHEGLGADYREGSDQRGVVVHVYLDPANPDGSTWDTLPDLEAEGSPLIQ